MDAAVGSAGALAAVALAQSPLAPMYPLDHTTSDGDTILLACVTSLDGDAAVAAIDTLLAAGASIEQPSGAPHSRTPLLQAAHVGNTAAVEALLEAGADTNATDADGRTALEVAVRCGNTASAMALVDGTTDIDHARRTMEFEFTSSGDGDADAGSDGDAGSDTELVSPLELACLLGHGELARELVRRDCGDLSMVSPRVAAAIASQGGAVAALASDPMNAEPVCPQGMWLCGAPCAWLCACVAVCGCLVCSPCDVPVCVCLCSGGGHRVLGRPRLCLRRAASSSGGCFPYVGQHARRAGSRGSSLAVRVWRTPCSRCSQPGVTAVTVCLCVQLRPSQASTSRRGHQPSGTGERCTC